MDNCESPLRSLVHDVPILVRIIGVLFTVFNTDAHGVDGDWVKGDGSFWKVVKSLVDCGVATDFRCHVCRLIFSPRHPNVDLSSRNLPSLILFLLTAFDME